MLVDSHAHLDHERFGDELELLLGRAWQAGVRTILSIGIGEGPSSMDGALKIARAYRDKEKTPRIYATAGVHPQEAAKWDTVALSNLDALLAEPEVLACGEIGLDFYHNDNPSIEVQRECFRAQMEVAAAHRKPIIIHCRPGTALDQDADEPQDAWEQCLGMLEQHWAPTGLRGILHCFTGDLGQAHRALALGFMISFAGNVTYPSAGALRVIAGTVPADRLLIETDCPFLAPIPERGKRNEPALVARTAEVLAQVRGISSTELARLTEDNFYSFFHPADAVPAS
ncbi:TatD family hydrolase [Acidipila sp. EB88]|uniref:TatD family hydrolase n=1 Tax=Acidipila sp. EB88 TaxID=2305226 RepID=UPI000F5ED4FB|nr:TatD family hydrolase [Acidipila sp. EB88]RRA47380.1 TatD family deoxyribonuclease [Acidipila sp. EB88]